MDLRGMFAKKPDPYAGADMRMAAVLGVPVWLATGFLTIALLPIAPPTLRLGYSGWIVALAAVALSAAAARRLKHLGGDVAPDELLVLSYLGVAVVATLQFVTGGNNSPFVPLFLMWSIYTAAAHPPRRTVVFLGVVVVLSSASLAYDGWDTLAAASVVVQLALLVLLSLMATIAISSFRAQRTDLREESEVDRAAARTDPLTGLGNRRAFDEALAAEIERGAEGRALSVLVSDVDGLKDINDNAGHPAGDRALRRVAQALQESLRSADMVYRWGGDEFVMLLPGTEPDAAVELAARVRDRVSSSCRRPDGSPLTVATGTAPWVEGMTAQELVESADLALLGTRAELGLR